MNRQLAETIRAVMRRGAMPLVLTGSCNSCMGVIGAFDHTACGVVWLDAHADFNTPDSTRSGFFAGMSAAIITGHCYRDYLHIDFDGFAPEVAPGIVEDPVPGGMSLEQAETIIRETGERFRIRAATLATYTPERDEDDKTLRVGLRLIDLIGEQTVARRVSA